MTFFLAAGRDTMTYCDHAGSSGMPDSAAQNASAMCESNADDVEDMETDCDPQSLSPADLFIMQASFDGK